MISCSVKLREIGASDTTIASGRWSSSLAAAIRRRSLRRRGSLSGLDDAHSAQSYTYACMHSHTCSHARTHAHTGVGHHSLSQTQSRAHKHTRKYNNVRVYGYAHASSHHPSTLQQEQCPLGRSYPPDPIPPHPTLARLSGTPPHHSYGYDDAALNCSLRRSII